MKSTVTDPQWHLHCIPIYIHLSWAQLKGTSCTSTRRSKTESSIPLAQRLNTYFVLGAVAIQSITYANSISDRHYSQYQHPVSFSKNILRGKGEATMNSGGIIFNLTGLDRCQLGVRRLQRGYIREQTLSMFYFSSITGCWDSCWHGKTKYP